MNKIYKLINSFSQNERKELLTFLISPYFNKNKSIITLYNLLLRNIKSNSLIEIDSEICYKKIFKNGKYKSSTMRNLISDLTNLILKFSALKYLEICESGYYEDSYMKSIRLRNLTNDFAYKFKDWSKNYLPKDNILEIDYAKEGLVYYNNKIDFEFMLEGETKKFDSFERIRDFKNLTVKSSLIDFLYAIKFYVGIAVVFMKSSTNKLSFPSEIYEIKNNYYNKILNQYTYLVNSGIKKDYLNIYLNLIEIYNAKINSKEVKLCEVSLLFQMITNYEKNLGKEENCFLFDALISLVGTLSISEEQTKLKFIIMKYYFNKEYFLRRDNNEIEASFFRLTLLAAFENKDFEYAKYFIDNYSRFIISVQRKAMTNLAYAFYYNRIRDFDQSLIYLNKIDMVKQIFEYDTRVLFIRNFYELNYIDSSLEQVYNFKILLSKKNKKAGLTFSEEAHLLFLNYFEKFIKDFEKKDVYSLEKLIINLKKEKNIILSIWLEKIISEKIEVLNKNLQKSKNIKKAV